MAIQNRRGDEADFLPGKMLPGEFAVSVDQKILRICFSNGVVRQIALTEDLEQAISEVSADLSGDISTLETSNNLMLQRIATLESTSTTHGNALTNHNNRITTLEGKADAHAQRLSNIETGIGGQVAQNTSDINTLKTQMTEAGEKIDALEDIEPVWSFEVNSDGQLIMTVERYTTTTFELQEGRLMVTYG